MTEEKTIRVPLADHPYDIRVTAGQLADFAKYLKTWCPDCLRVAIITDQNVGPLHAATVAKSLAGEEIIATTFTVPPGEESKSVSGAFGLWQRLTECGADRRTVVVAVGGGVVGDLAGFVAATLLRGLRFVQVPTTLLACVDSSVGGKVGINLPQGKNLVGAFLQPEGVLIDMETLRTLDDRQLRAGLAEVVKYGVILDANFFAFLEKNADAILLRDETILAEIIARCCELKAMIVAEDERETTGRRAVLNYGHTLGHAAEKLCGYGTLLHGEAVGIGMVAAARLACLLAEKENRPSVDLHALADRQLALLLRLGIPTQFPFENFPPEDILGAILHDKKADAGICRFILPERLGFTVFRGVDDHELILAATK